MTTNTPTPADIANQANAAVTAANNAAETAQDSPTATNGATADQTNGTAQNGDQADPQQGDTFDRAYVERLRRESAQYRTRAETAATEAAAQARQDLAQEIGKALGLVDQGQADPQQLLEQATRDRDAQTTALRAQTAENTVLRAAGAQGLTLDDADRLLDSRRFTTALDAIDTDATDYADQVSALIQQHHTPRSTPAVPPAASHQHTGGQTTDADTSVSGFRTRFFGSK